MNIIKHLAKDAGLADGGKDTEGNQLWIGTDQQWIAFQRLMDDYDKYAEEEENNIMERAEIYK